MVGCYSVKDKATGGEYPHVDISLGAYYPYYCSVAQTLLKYFPVGTALDIGCNVGALVKAFVDSGIEAYGVDVSRIAVSNAPQELKGRIMLLDIAHDKLPFEDGKFDLITMLDVVEHLTSFEGALCEMRRVLRPGGYIYISTPSKLTDIIRNIMTWHKFNNPWHVNVHSKRYWIKLFESHGLDYLHDFPKAERKKAIASLFQSPLRRLILKIYSMPFFPNISVDLIFQKQT